MTNEGTWLPTALCEAKLARSASEGRRMISYGAVSVGGEVVLDAARMLEPGRYVLPVWSGGEFSSATVSVHAPRPVKKRSSYTACGAMAPVEEPERKGCTAKEWSDAAIDKIREAYGPVAASFVEESRRPVDLYEINVSPGQVLTLTGETRALVLGLPTSSPLLPGQRLADAVAMPAAIEDARWRWRLRTGGAVSVDMDQRGTVYLHFEAGGFSNVQMMSVTRPDLVACSMRNMTDAWLTAREGERVRR